MFRCGQYVRHTKQDMGTGQVVRIETTEWLTQDGLIKSDAQFGVKWLDMKPVTMALHPAYHLAAAARNVPTFTSIEEADAWMEAQASGGSWVGAAEDLNATVAEVLNQEAGQLVADIERSLTVTCGSAACGCQDCVTYMSDDGEVEHSGSMACNCFAKDCGCTHKS